MSTVLNLYEKNPEFQKEENIYSGLLARYERVIVESLIKSFGLDFIIKDRHGGDVDTIHNVRKIGNDSQMNYKNSANAADYENRGEYNSYDYHHDKNYIDINRNISTQKKNGNLYDAYTGEVIPQNGRTDLDHVISAKEIHEDRGRVLAGLSGTDLANTDINLKATNAHTNRSKKADSMNDFLERRGDEYSETQKQNMRRVDAEARRTYEQKISADYYYNSKFLKDSVSAAANVGVKMGLRQVMGFVFAEIWFEVKDELQKKRDSDFGKLLSSIGDAIKRGFKNAKSKYKKLLDEFCTGTVSGVLASLTTTLCNIFFTTSKNVVRIIRQTYASIVEALKILFINPDNLPFGDRMKAVAKILSVGASVVVGTLVSEAVQKTGVGTIPVVGEIISDFCGAFVSGIMSCSLLFYLDRSKTVQKIVNFLNQLTVSEGFRNFAEDCRRRADKMEAYAAELMQINVSELKMEINKISSLTQSISNAQTEEELNFVLKKAYLAMGIKTQWGDDFRGFITNRNNRLVFK